MSKPMCAYPESNLDCEQCVVSCPARKDNIALKRCPFCGKHPQVKQNGDVYCLNCSIHMPRKQWEHRA